MQKEDLSCSGGLDRRGSTSCGAVHGFKANIPTSRNVDKMYAGSSPSTVASSAVFARPSSSRLGDEVQLQQSEDDFASSPSLADPESNLCGAKLSAHGITRGRRLSHKRFKPAGRHRDPVDSGESSRGESPEVVTVASSRESSVDAKEEPLQRTGLSFNLGRLTCTRSAGSSPIPSPPLQVERKRFSDHASTASEASWPTNPDAKRRRAHLLPEIGKPDDGDMPCERATQLKSAMPKIAHEGTAHSGTQGLVKDADEVWRMRPSSFQESEHIDMEKIWHF
jgi:hypothetical protein